MVGSPVQGQVQLCGIAVHSDIVDATSETGLDMLCAQ